MKPAKALRIFLVASCLLGLAFTVFTAQLLKAGEIELNAALLLPVCWNVFFMLILPQVLDWSEKKYFKARFLQLEELANDNPELKAYIEAQCKKLAVSGIRLAVLDSSSVELFSYGLWRYNPRLIVPSSIFVKTETERMMPSIELELSRFAKQGLSSSFIVFTLIQILVQQLIVRFI